MLIRIRLGEHFLFGEFMFERYYSFGKFNGMFGVWNSFTNYDEVVEEKLLVYKDNDITKHSEKYMVRRNKMTRSFYNDSNIPLIKLFVRKYLLWI